MLFEKIRVFFRRLRTRLAIIIAAAMLPAGVVAIQQALSVADRQDAQADTLRESEAQEQAMGERNLLIEVRESMDFALRRLRTNQFADITCDEALKSEFQFRRWLTFAALLDKNGHVLCHFPGRAVPGQIAGWAEYKRRGSFTISQPSGTSDAAVINAFFPDVGGRAEALAVGIDLNVLKGYSRVSPTDQPFALIGNEGGILTNSRPNDDWLPAKVAALPGYRHIIRGTSRSGKPTDYLVYLLIPGQVWSVSAYPTRSTGAFIFSPAFIAVLAPIVLWLIAVGVAYVAIDRLVTRHVKRLKRATVKIGEGHRSERMGDWPSAPQEFQELGAAVDRMATQIEDRETALEDLLRHQKSLLMEVHHRVKNNLQMISSLMNIQFRRGLTQEQSRSMQLVQERIHSLAMVHQNLYSAERLDRVELARLITDISDYQLQSLNPDGCDVEVNRHLEDVAIDSSIASPVALFVTEAISNVFKHAVNQGRTTRIEISLVLGDGEFTVTVSNDAPLPGGTADGRDRKDGGLGLRLMEGFATQLGGHLEKSLENGRYSVSLTAPIRDDHRAFNIRVPAD